MKKFFTLILTAIIFLTAMSVVFAASYIGNRKSKVFHYPGCTSAVKMKIDNRVYFYSREEAIGGGFRPCKKCSP